MITLPRNTKRYDPSSKHLYAEQYDMVSSKCRPIKMRVYPTYWLLHSGMLSRRMRGKASRAAERQRERGRQWRIHCVCVLHLFIMKVNLYNPFSFWLISIRSHEIFINSFLLYYMLHAYARYRHKVPAPVPHGYATLATCRTILCSGFFFALRISVSTDTHSEQ